MLAQEMQSAGVTFTEAQLNLSGLLSMTLKSTAAPSTPGPLGIMQQILEQWMTEADQQGAAKPLLIIDEANRLADWKEDAALQGLLDMLVRVSKQDNKCHVILGTSEDFMYYWLLHRGLRQNQVVTMTLGNLSEEAAKSFVDDELLPGINSKLDRTGFNLEPSMWPQLYAVCGGNFGALRTTTETAANLFNAGRSLEDAWTAAFREKLVAAQLTVKLGFNPANLPPRAGEKPAWTPRQWGAALEELTEAPHHVVPEERMVAVLGRYALLRRDEAGRAALESLVRFNLLSLRRPSEIAFDLPPEVYGDDGQVTVVTVPYQASLAYILSGKWKQIRQLQLPRFIDRWWPWQL